MRRSPRWVLITTFLVAVVTAGMAAQAARLPAAALAAFTRGVAPDLLITVSEVSAPWATEANSRHTKITVIGTSRDPVTVTIWHDGREVLSFPNVQRGQLVDFRILKDFASGSWAVRASSDSHEANAEIPVAMHWAPMAGASPTFEPCDVVGWHVDSTGAPTSAGSVSGDIRTALDQLHGATGLTFTEVEDKADADLTYAWTSEGTEWKSGVGGMRTLADGRRQGYVKLNAGSVWVTRPGFEFVDGKPGRGVLILHETGHALGLGHVNDIGQIMNPTPAGVGHLGDGDLAGLAWLYRPETCSRE